MVVAISLCVLLIFLLSPGVMPGMAQETAERHWERLGPNRIALWSFPPNYEQDGGIFLATSAVEKMSLRGVYLSTDRGDTWTNRSEGLNPKKRYWYTVLAFSPTFADDSTVWLFGHKTGLAVKEAYGGFWESTDKGATWTEIDYKGFPYREMTTRVSQDIIGVVISPKIAEDGLMIAAAGGEGVYISRDKGRNWELLNPVKDVTDIFAPPTFPDEPFLALATTGSQVMVSTDGGKTFETRGNGLPENMTSVRKVVFSQNFAQDRKMFSYGTEGVFTSDDAGMTWKTLATPEKNISIEAMAVVGDFAEYGSIAYGTDDAKVYLSDDMGQTFTSTGAETLISAKIDTIEFTPDYKTSRQLFVSSADGIFRYGPVQDAGAGANAQVVAAAVDATRVARATAVAGLEFVPQQSNRVETGCIAFAPFPVMALGLVVFTLKKRSHK